jgi:hypothetical protein
MPVPQHLWPDVYEEQRDGSAWGMQRGRRNKPRDYLIVADAAEFFFPGHNNYLALTEVRLDDRHGKSAGNLDIVLVALNNSGEIIDFGALEVQAVYISGNIGNVFKAYMADPERNAALEWPSKNYPKPDFLSSSRKRLAPQLIYKGGILNSWGKKLAVCSPEVFLRPIAPIALCFCA